MAKLQLLEGESVPVPSMSKVAKALVMSGSVCAASLSKAPPPFPDSPCSSADAISSGTSPKYETASCSSSTVSWRLTWEVCSAPSPPAELADDASARWPIRQRSWMTPRCRKYISYATSPSRKM